jgi:hypothetical protein
MCRSSMFFSASYLFRSLLMQFNNLLGSPSIKKVRESYDLVSHKMKKPSIKLGFFILYPGRTRMESAASCGRKARGSAQQADSGGRRAAGNGEVPESCPREFSWPFYPIPRLSSRIFFLVNRSKSDKIYL